MFATLKYPVKKSVQFRDSVRTYMENETLVSDRGFDQFWLKYGAQLWTSLRIKRNNTRKYLTDSVLACLGFKEYMMWRPEDGGKPSGLTCVTKFPSARSDDEARVQWKADHRELAEMVGSPRRTSNSWVVYEDVCRGSGTLCTAEKKTLFFEDAFTVAD